MTRPFQIGYVELSVADLDKELNYYDNVLGATTVERGNKGAAYLSFCVDHHNVALVPGSQPGLLAIGFRIAVELKDATTKLQRMGIAAEIRSDARPGVASLIQMDAPGGPKIHLYSEMTAPAPGYRNSGIVPTKFGHIAVMSAESKKLVAFFAEALGFVSTDWFGEDITFMTSNHEHHMLVVLASPESKMHHMAFQLRDNSHHVEASDLLSSKRIPLAWGPARHTAGHNISSYHFDPSGFLVEFYSDLDIFVPQLNSFEPRPWHDTFPQKPRVWPLEKVTTWGAKYDFNFQV